MKCDSLYVFSDYAGFNPRMQLNIFRLCSLPLSLSVQIRVVSTTYLAEGVVVERAAVVLALRRALRPALLNVRHEADVGVGEGQVGAGPIHVLAIVWNCENIMNETSIDLLWLWANMRLVQGGDGGRLNWVGFTLSLIFHHFAQQPSGLCQINICPSRTGQKVECPKL